MAIAASKLGRLIAQEWQSEEALIRRLREADLVTADATDDDLRTAFTKARDEHDRLGQSPYNSPNERARVFLAPFLTGKGQRWAVPLQSLDLPDD